MSKYFNHFPKTLYTNDDKGNNLNTVTNIIARFSFEESLKENSSAFYKYDIKEGDTPEIIASKFYGNPERHWIILLFNNIIDPQWDWPLNYRTLNEYINEKYTPNAIEDNFSSGLSWARSLNEDNAHSFYKVIETTLNADGTKYVDKVQISREFFDSLSDTTTTYPLPDGYSMTEKITKELKSHYDYELELNEKKRTIKLLKTDFVTAVEKEFKRVVKL